MDESFQEAVKKLKDTYNNVLVDSDAKDWKTREICYLMIRGIDELVGQLDSFITIGKEARIKKEATKTIKQLSKGITK